MRVLLLAVAAGLLASGTAFAAEKPVNFWVAKGAALETDNVKLVAIGQQAGKTKLSKSCGKEGQFERWTAMTSDRGGGVPQMVSIVSEPLPANGAKLSSLRVEGECTVGQTTWVKYSGVMDKTKPAASTKAKPAATPKKDEKKKDDKKKSN